MMLKTERLTIKVLPSDKANLARIAQAEGEPVAVVVRRLLRQAVANLQAQDQAARDAMRLESVAVCDGA